MLFFLPIKENFILCDVENENFEPQYLETTQISHGTL